MHDILQWAQSANTGAVTKISFNFLKVIITLYSPIEDAFFFVKHEVGVQ